MQHEAALSASAHPNPQPRLVHVRPGPSGGAFLGKRLLFPSLPLSSLLTASAKPKCSLLGEVPNPKLQGTVAPGQRFLALTAPGSGGQGMTAAGPTSLLQLCVLQGCQTNTPILHPPHQPHLLQPVLGPEPASAPPLHTRTDTPLPSPQRGGQPAWYPGSSGPSAPPEDPHPSHRNKSADPRRPARAPGLAADLPWPRHDPGRLPRHGSPASCTSRIYPSPGEGSPGNASAVPGPAPGFLHRLFRLGEQWSCSLRFLRPSKLCSSLPARSASISQRAKASQSTRSLRVRAQTCPHSVKNLGG